MRSVGVDTVEVGQPDASAREVDGGTIHVDRRAERTDKVTNVIGDHASGLDTTQGDRKRGGTGGAGEGGDLSRYNVAEVLDWVTVKVKGKA